MRSKKSEFLLSAALIFAVVFGAAQRGGSVELSVDVTSGQKPISPYIYGLNEAKESFANEIGLPVLRWGGDHLSRYDWTTNFTNEALDWFFENNIHMNGFTGMAETSDQWVTQNRNTGTASIITVPIMGYVAKDGVQSTCAFNTTQFPVQNSIDGAYPNCGNGFAGPAGTANIPSPSPAPAYLTGNNPLDTSKVVDQTFIADWVKHLKTTFGTAAAGGIKFYALDNEPGLWHETHRDVHPIPLTYDESFSRGKVYAAAIKAADPSALVLGPVQTLWAGYFYASYVTQSQAETDRNNHGGIDFIPWYLQQMKNYQTVNGIRILDYLDLHFYPENKVELVLDNGDAATQALRLRSTRSFWDPTYVDESLVANSGLGNCAQAGITGCIQLIPRMRDWVNANYPGTKTAITEYNWGALETINGALTQADILGIFGKEGLDMANLFNGVDPGDPLHYKAFDTLPGAYAFRMYRNYDGLGGKFGDVSITASSADQGQLAIYAAKRTSDAAITIMVINKSGASQTGNIAMTGISNVSAAQVYRYSAANLNTIKSEADQPISATGISASFPANSITLFVVKQACTYTLSPTSQSFTSSGGTGSVTVTASSSSCAWIATSSLSWVTITSGSSGIGNGTVTISVSANTTGATRTGNITIAGKTFMITQSDSIFADISSTNAFYSYINAIYSNNPPITVGCNQNPLMYCPDAYVTRGQMAAFIIRAKYGENSTYTLTPYFSDVSATNGFFKYVQKMKDAGITSVIGAYDVNGTVTRGQMAAFIIRAKYGENFTYTTTPYFSDVPATNVFFKYVQKMKDANITAVTGTYNVDGTVTRGQMAAFIARAFLGMP